MLEAKGFKKPDETREFGHGKLEIISIGSGTVGKSTFEPGWKWSNDVKPIAKTDSCQVNHFGFVVSGRMKIVHDDGTDLEIGPGDVINVPAGHDAWVVGDESCVIVDWAGNSTYAKR
jgi:hypothetical protein